LEFKRDLSSLLPVLKTIIAFANTAGGIIIIGCSPPGIITGVQNIFKEEERLANAIADSIHPFLLPELEVATLEEKDLLIIKVAHWKGPFYLKKEGMPKGVYVRFFLSPSYLLSNPAKAVDQKKEIKQTVEVQL